MFHSASQYFFSKYYFGHSLFFPEQVLQSYPTCKAILSSAPAIQLVHLAFLPGNELKYCGDHWAVNDKDCKVKLCLQRNVLLHWLNAIYVTR